MQCSEPACGEFIEPVEGFFLFVRLLFLKEFAGKSISEAEAMRMKPIIIITTQEYGKAEAIFKSCPDFECKPAGFDENALASVVKDNNAFGVILGVDAYKDKLYQSLPRGGIISRFGVGHDGVDKQRATENGVIVANTPGVLDDSVAEHAVLLMGCFARNISRHAGDMKNKKWQPAVGGELKGKLLLILGCGPIGRKTAKIASFGFGMNVIGYDVAKLDEEQLRRNYGFNGFAPSHTDAISQADYISMHIPSLPATKHFVDKVFLSKLKPGCVIINTARGAVIDEVALYDALKAKQIAGAALDVFENEPFAPVNPAKDLRMLDNVILTPHVGSSTVEACHRMARSCLINIAAAYAKQYEKINVLNPQVLAKL